MREFFSVNGDLFVRSLCLMAVYLAFTAISARFGDTLLAMSSIMMKLMMIFSYFTDGFAFAGWFDEEGSCVSQLQDWPDEYGRSRRLTARFKAR